MKGRIKWLGHAAFMLETSGGKTVLFDPWISGNPACPIEVDELQKVDLVLITHDHADHGAGDVGYLVDECGAKLAAQPELKEHLQEKFDLEDEAFLPGMNIGGTVEFDGLAVTMVQAFHSASAGYPCGFILTTEEEKRIYHAGDTGIFATMQTLGDLYELDMALLPTGSTFVMDSRQAAHATALLRPDKVIPMHYATFEVLEPDAEKFAQLVEDGPSGAEVIVAEPGDWIEV